MATILPFPRKPETASSPATLAAATEQLFLSVHGDAVLAAHMGAWARDQWTKYQALHPQGIPVQAGFEQMAAQLLGEVAKQYEILFHEMWLDQLQIEAQRFALERDRAPPVSGQ